MIIRHTDKFLFLVSSKLYDRGCIGRGKSLLIQKTTINQCSGNSYLKFKNQSMAANNDDVLDDPVVDLSRKTYQIRITPGPPTTFWRFGIVLSREPGFAFDPRSGTYRNQELKYLEIHAGDHKLVYRPDCEGFRPIASANVYPPRVIS